MTNAFSVDDVRLAISLAIIGQQFLIALVLLKGRPTVRAQWLGALLLLGVIAYLILSNSVLSDATSAFRPITVAFAIAIPYLLWEFSIAIFEIHSVSLPLRLAIYVVPFIVWLMAIGDTAGTMRVARPIDILNHIVGLILITHAVASVYLDRRDDLLEPRRRYRALFVLFIALQVGVVLVVELVLGYSDAPDWLELTNVIMIMVLTLGLSLPLLLSDGQILWHGKSDTRPSGRGPPANGLAPADHVLNDALNAAMQAGFYRTQGLGIRELAAELKVPEHQLRKLINQHLGYRNFSAFRNDQRIGEAKVRLADPEFARVPVLTVAMDIGYGSIGPFNRAFKEVTGLTPTDFRRQKLGHSVADSE